jgi:hypothetical protein
LVFTTPDGESESIKIAYFTDEEKKELKRQLQEYARRVREELREQEKLERSTEEESKKRGRSSGSTTAGTGRRFTLEALDRSHAKIVRNLTEATGWFADVLNEVGFYAVIIAMQHAKVPPEELYERVVQFKDPAEFSRFVKDHLAALFEASEDAHALIELRKQLDVLDAKLVLLKEAFNNIKNQRDETLMMLQTATASMCDECLKRFMLAWMSVKYGLSVRMGGVEFGGTVGEGSGEEEGDTRGRGEATA